MVIPPQLPSADQLRSVPKPGHPLVKASRDFHLVSQWIHTFPASVAEAVITAMGTASLPKIRRALRLIAELEPKVQGPVLNIEILSTFNVEPILPVMQLALNCLPSQAHLQLAPLDDIEGYIAQPPATDRSRQLDARIILWRLEEVLPEALYPVSHGFPEQVAARTNQLVERIERVVGLHQRNARGVPLFLSTIALPIHFSNPIFAAQHSAGLFSSVVRVNEKVYDLATHNDQVRVLDLFSWAAFEGRAYADATVDFLARQPLSAKGQVAFAVFLARSVRPLIVPRRKALALDLDNTLWGGVIGEDGVERLELGHDFPGSVHLRIQRELLELRHRGVLLVMLSKNNETDVRQAFESLPNMILKWTDFAARKINWDHKHENLRDAARELGLGLDSFVFLDDADYEREQMRQLIPEVLILNDSPDPLHILRSLWETDVFDCYALTHEDQRRHEDYELRGTRDVGAHQHDLQAFLTSLEMVATIEEVGSSNLERVVTMLGKTNQFNVTTRRHSRAQVERILELPGSIALALKLRDKFSDQGVIAVLLAVVSREATLEIDNFLVSCRALGRGVEDALWAAMVSRARQQNNRRVEAQYIRTAKNSVVAELFDRLGLQRMGHDDAITHYVLEPIVAAEFPSWITLAGHGNEF